MEFSTVTLVQKLQQDLKSSRNTNEVTWFRKRVLFETLLKKHVPRGANDAMHVAAIDDFVNRNNALSQVFIVPQSRAELFKDWRYKLFDVINSGSFQSSKITLDTCFNYGIAGPGASRLTKHTNLLDKMFNSNLSSSSEILFSHYESMLTARWERANELRKLIHANVLCHGSLLTSVPKDAKKNRTICTEPSLNMFYQLGAKEIINRLLVTHYHLDVRTQQDINKDLARQGSLDGSNATLDLKNASDTIHMDLVRQLLPDECLNTLMCIRSRFFEAKSDIQQGSVGSHNGRNVYEFNMISSMGNGFTFSLMTLLLTTLLDVFLRTKRSRYVPLRDGVFGDDIIMPSKYAAEFCDVLSDFGFTVNSDKSYIAGDFRESCGGDYFRGFNVRGVYLKELNCEADIYSAFNRLLRWSCSFGIPLTRTLSYLKGLVVFRPIPQGESDDGGLKVPFETIRTSITRDVNGSYVYECLVPCTRTRRVGTSKIKKLGDVGHLYHAALICVLGGYVRNYRLTVRSYGVTKRKVQRRVIPNWDYTTLPGFSTQEYLDAYVSIIALT